MHCGALGRDAGEAGERDEPDCDVLRVGGGLGGVE